MASTNPARGMRDFLPADVRKRDYVIGIIKEVYESYGFEPLETPAVENIETLMGKYGDEGNQLIFKILKRGEAFSANLKGFAGVVKAGSYGTDEENDPSYATAITREFCDLALRYDLTVPLARVVANNREKLPKFFKRYQIQPVWRADRPARGRFREFYQCDVDSIGSSSMVVEAEIISAAAEILTRLGFYDFKIRINHRAFLTAFLNSYELPERMHSSVLTALDKIDKIEAEGVVSELVERGIVEQNAADLLDSLTSLQAMITGALAEGLGLDTFFEMLEGSYGASREGSIALGELKQIWSLVSQGPAGPHLSIDLSLARGLSYYTGTIIEINVEGIGSLGGGGRYDGLIGMFGKEQIPACGFSLGLERILVVMEERGMFPPDIAESTPADVMVTIWNEDSIGESLKPANELRSQGLRVTVYPQADKEDKQWKYANSIGVPWICTVNADDIAAGMVSFQDLRTRERFREPLDKVAAKIDLAL